MPKRYTDEQIDAALAQANGNKAEASRILGMTERGFHSRYKRLTAARARQGYTAEVPDGFRLTGKSTLIDRRTGETVLEWVKQAPDAQRQREMMEAALAALSDEIPLAEPVKAPASVLDALANCYIITDYHLGMYAWHEETGADWDASIAEDLLVDWFAEAVRAAPDAAVGILAELGDFLHWDGMDAVTPASKHLLDADTRFALLVRVAIRVVRRIIDMMLHKHQTVVVFLLEGNHNPASSVWMRELMAALYENEPRVIVDCSPDPYYCYEHGETSLFFHHGHKRKPANIADVFAAKFRDVFGRTKHSFAHMGHMHHTLALETNLMVVEQHRTLAAPDAYASRGGWMSGRDAKVITYHKQYGEVGRITISPDMVKAA